MSDIPSLAGMTIPMVSAPRIDEAAAIAHHSKIYDELSPFMIDRWPESVRALSFPTTMIEVDPADMAILYDYGHADWRAKAQALADRLDDAMDWRRHFIRLNSRSPKDAAPSLITCSGRQAVDWLATSERCLDDTVTFMRSGKPMYVCLREARHLDPDGEFRCYAKGGRVLAVSRYFRQIAPAHLPEAGAVMAAAQRFYEDHLRAFYRDVVFDIYAPGSPEETLIEINPYGWSDPCMFEGYEEIETIGGERLGEIGQIPADA